MPSFCPAKLGTYGDAEPCPRYGSEKFGGRCCEKHTQCRYKTAKETPCTKVVKGNEMRCPMHKRMEEGKKKGKKNSDASVDDITTGLKGIHIQQTITINGKVVKETTSAARAAR